MSSGTNFSVSPPPQSDSIPSDNMINGMISSEGGIVGVVKRHKKGDHGRSSVSTQGSGREEALRRSSSSSSGDDDEVNDKRRRKGQRKPRSHPIFPMDDEDDERTDSASEGMEIDTSADLKGYNHQLANFPTAHPTTSILKPLSPILTVGYGADLVVSQTPRHQDNCATPTLNSPHNSDGHVSSSGILSPEISIAQDPSPLTSNHDNCGTTLLPLATTPVIPGTGPIPNGGTSVLSSSSITAAANALPFAGWWGQPTMYSPFCGPGGSVATTPVGTDAYLRSGTSVYLRAVICHESDGVLIVNVHWRNKSFSGSLIDINQHQWAPPRLSEGIPDLSIQLKDLYSKQDSEKEPIDVVIDEDREEDEGDDEDEIDKEEMLKDEDNKMIEEANEIRQNNVVVKPPPIDNHLSDVSDVSDNENNPKVSQPSSVLLAKPPNGLQIPSIITAEKLNPKPLLPSFDAVKSPQPEIGRDDKDPHKVSSKKDDVVTEPRPVSPGDNKPVIKSSYISPTVPSSETHHNLNTLVDVATKMKPVSKELETQNATYSKTKKHGERNKSYGRFSSVQNPTSVSGSGHESDSSGSGSISPVRKKHAKQHTKDNKLLRGGGGSTLKVPRDESSGVSRQPDTPAFGNMPFQFDLTLRPISPGEDNPDKDHHPVKKVPKSNTDSSYSGGQWGGPLPHKDLKETKPPGIPNIVVPSIIEFSQSSHTNDSQPFAMPATFGQPPSVIQDKKRKRKTTPNNEPNKRPSPPLRDWEDKSLPPLPPSLAKNPTGKETHIIQGHDHMKSPEGFIYDPSLPMTYEYQLIAFQRQKAAEEKADRNTDRKTPPRVIKQPHHIDHLLPYETTTQNNRQSSPVLPPHSATFGRNKVVAPGVLISPDHHHRVMSQHALSIKQQEPIPRPNRPSSKGNHHPSTLKPPSHQTKKQSSRRLESHPGNIQIKQEPESLQMSHHHHQPGFITFPGFPLPPGSTPAFQTLPQGTPTSASPSSSSGVLQGVSVVPPAWHVSGINPPSSLKSEPHTVRNQPEHHMPRLSSTRTPSPNSHKKPHEWQHHHGIHHVITSNKHEPQTSRHHDNKPIHPMVSSHATSSAGRSQHSSKHESSSRHIHTPSSHQPPPPTTPATITQLSPTHIAALHGNGLSVEDWLKQVQIMQHLEALQKSGGVVAPTAIPTPVHPQEFALWQNQMTQFAAMGQVPVDQATAIQMQLAIQQQQQQQQTQALAAQGLIPLMQPFQLGTPAVVPFATLPPPPKRDS